MTNWKPVSFSRTMLHGVSKELRNWCCYNSITITLTLGRQFEGDGNEGTQFWFWFLSLYAWQTGDTSRWYCFNCLWPSGKYMYRVSYDHRNRIFLWYDDPQWARPHHCRGFTITPTNPPKQTHTLSRIPLDQWSASRRDLYLATYNTYKRQTTMPPVGFEPAISASEQSQTHALDRAVNGIALSHITCVINWAVERT